MESTHREWTETYAIYRAILNWLLENSINLLQYKRTAQCTGMVLIVPPDCREPKQVLDQNNLYAMPEKLWLWVCINTYVSWIKMFRNVNEYRMIRIAYMRGSEVANLKFVKEHFSANLKVCSFVYIVLRMPWWRSCNVTVTSKFSLFCC